MIRILAVIAATCAVTSNAVAGDIADKLAADDARTKKILAERKVSGNVCEALCRLYAKGAQWAPGHLRIGNAPFDPASPAFGWEGTVKTLGFLFVARATPYCDKDARGMGALLSDWFRDREKAPPPKAAVQEPPVSDEEFEKLVKELPEETRKQLKKFRESAGTESAPSGPGQIDLYGMAFYGTLLRHLTGDEAAAAILEKTGGKAASLVASAAKTFSPRIASAGMETHLVAATLLAMGDSKTKEVKAAVTQLNGLVRDAKEKNKSPLAIPNQATFESGNWKTDAFGGGPRALMVHLALFVHDKDAERRKTHERHLRLAVENYLARFYDYFGGAGKEQPFDTRSGTATIAYLAAATRLLAGTKAGAADLVTRLRGRVLTQLGADGLYAAPKGSPQLLASYANPQLGLALSALLDPETDRCPAGPAVPSAGILDAATGAAAVSSARATTRSRLRTPAHVTL